MMNTQNELIAAREAKQAQDISPDYVRIQREKERREKLGQLRAREHPGKHPHRARHMFPFQPL